MSQTKPRPSSRQLRVGFFLDKGVDSAELGARLNMLGTSLLPLGITFVLINPPDWTKQQLPDPFDHFNCRFRDDLAAYLSTLRNTSIRSLEDVIQFNNEHAAQERVQEVGQSGFMKSLASKTITQDPEYCLDLQRKYRHAGREHEQFGFETLRGRLGSQSDIIMIAGLSGYPAIAIPVGIDSSGAHPIGASLMTNPGNEGALFAVSKATENSNFNRVPPRLRARSKLKRT